MKTVIEGVLSGTLPWGLVGVGSALTISALIAGLPGLAFAVGIYLPLGSLTPIFLGGIVRRIVESRRSAARAGESDPGVLAASGMIAGEGLAGVLIAFLVAATGRWPQAEISRGLAALHFGEKQFTWISGAAGVVLGIAIVLGICALLYRAARVGHAPEGVEAERASVEAK
jgi:hypothetical protein